MGKLSLYRSRRNIRKKFKGCPKKYAMPLKTKDIDTTLSYESSSDCDESKEGETSNAFHCDVHETPNQELLADPSQILMEQMEIVMFRTMLTYGTVNMQEGVSNDSEVLISSLPSYQFCIKVVACMTLCY